MNKLNKADINNISNDYILKSIFSNIDYQLILKIIKNNNQLKYRLGIDINNYKNLSDIPKYEHVFQKTKYSRPNLTSSNFFIRSMHVTFGTSCLTLLFFFIV